MNDPNRFTDDPSTKTTGALLAEGASSLERPWSPTERAELIGRIEHRLAKPRPIGRFIFVATAVCALLVGLYALTTRSPAKVRTVELAQEATLEVSENGAIDLPKSAAATEGRRIVLKQGQVCAEVAHRDLDKQGPLFVEAPNLVVTVIGTHFCVDTANGESQVAVTRGRVRAQRSRTSPAVEVTAGESIRSDDPRLRLTLAIAAPAPMAALPPESHACAQAIALDAQRGCFQKLSSGEGLAAQNALYGLALLERDRAHDDAAALAKFRAYSARFPHGVFAPEAALGAFDELLKAKRYPEALIEANRALSLGQSTEATALLHRFLEEFPQGVHAAEAPSLAR